MCVCKQTFHVYRVRISQKAKSVTMEKLKTSAYYFFCEDKDIDRYIPYSRDVNLKEFIRNVKTNIFFFLICHFGGTHHLRGQDSP